MSVYPNGGRFSRRFMTRFGGGFTIPELIIAGFIGLVSYMVSGHTIYVPPMAFAFSLFIAMNVGRLPTDERRFSKWLRDSASYCLRVNPLRSRHIQGGKNARPSSPTPTGGVIHIVGKKGRAT